MLDSLLGSPSVRGSGRSVMVCDTYPNIYSCSQDTMFRNAGFAGLVKADLPPSWFRMLFSSSDTLTFPPPLPLSPTPNQEAGSPLNRIFHPCIAGTNIAPDTQLVLSEWMNELGVHCYPGSRAKIFLDLGPGQHQENSKRILLQTANARPIWRQQWHQVCRTSSCFYITSTHLRFSEYSWYSPCRMQSPCITLP